MNQDRSQDRMLRYPELKQEFGIPYSKVWISKLEAKGRFPKRVRISQNTVVWSAKEVARWVAATLNADILK